jgi:hypothetical protein
VFERTQRFVRLCNDKRRQISRLKNETASKEITETLKKLPSQ